MIRVCIIEDILEIQNGLVSILKSDKRFQVLRCFDNAEDAILELPSLMPNIVITDINLPFKSGIECVREIKNKYDEIQFIMFTIYDENEQVFEALKAGASAYILKNTFPTKIIDSLIELNEGGSPMSPKIARKVLLSFSQIQNNEIDTIISSREKEVLELLSKGFLYKEISDKLNISINTVKKHLNHVYTKLQVQNKTEAVNKLYGK